MKLREQVIIVVTYQGMPGCAEIAMLDGHKLNMDSRGIAKTLASTLAMLRQKLDKKIRAITP